MKTRVFYFLIALLLATALWAVTPVHAQNQGNRRLGNVVITNNATASGQVPCTNSATTGTWTSSCAGGGGGGSGSGATWPLTAYASLPTCTSSNAPVEYWVTGVPGGACRNNYPPALTYDTGGSSTDAQWASGAVAIAPSGSSNPTITGTTVNSAGSCSMNEPSAPNGNLLVLVVNNFSGTVTLTGWNLAGTQSAVDSFDVQVFTRIAASESGSITLTSGCNLPGMAMYSISGAVASTTPDAISFGGDGSGTTSTAVTPALTGLSSAKDLLLGIYAVEGTQTITATGTLTQDQFVHGVLGTNVPIWIGHLVLAANSAAAQDAALTSGPLTGNVTCKLACKEFLDGTYAYVEEGP